MTTSHTPGPWVRDTGSGFGCDVRAQNGRKVAATWGINNSDPHRPAYRAECDANARLIAAAPELLEALETLAECAKYGDVIEGADAWKDARAAIAKAKGEQPKLDAGLPRAAFPHMSPAEYLAQRLREDDEDLQDLMDRDMGG